MGNWHISIRGTGAHHNPDHPGDANRMAKRFVDDLVSAGHIVTGADFHHGGVEVLGCNAHHSGIRETKADPGGVMFTLADGSKIWLSEGELRAAVESIPPGVPPATNAPNG